jgi:hypothetical protein
MVLSALTRLGRAGSRFSRAGRHKRWNGGLLFAALAISALTQCTGGPLTLRRVDLKVLILNINDGTAPGVAAIRDELKLEGVPFTELDLNSPTRPVINAAFLSSTAGTNPVIERAMFQAVVTPNEATTQLSVAERDAIAAFESKFGVRHVNAATWANPAVGLNYAQNPGFIGALDNMTATVTPAGLASPFTYLNGPLPFEVGSYGYLATPLATLPAGASYTPLVTVPIPGTTTPGSIVGVYKHDGREELSMTASFNGLQQQFRGMGRGLVTWMTKGVHLGYDRSYLTVHVDDLFAADSRWNAASNCTPGEDCPATVVAGADIRMTPADMAAAVAWQTANGFKFDWAFNGFGSDSYVEENGSDPLLVSAKANVAAFFWINHTYTHQFLGCLQDATVIPWRCQTDAAGQINYLDQAAIQGEITTNVNFATVNGLPIDRTELVTGEHSGLYILPQQPVDNPNLAPALTATGIAVTGADASRQIDSRLVGTTRTLPRYPMANFFNVGTKAEMIDEYNYIFTGTTDGGSGICTLNPATMTCLAPINATTGYDDFIVPLDTTVTLRHLLGNDPRPHYVHQSNLAEERILLPLMNSILGRYRSMFNATAPTVHATETQAANVLTQQATWSAGQGQVEAYTLGNEVYVNKGTYTGAVPITAPNGTRVGSPTGAPFGEAYAGDLSAWTPMPAVGSYRLTLLTAP